MKRILSILLAMLPIMLAAGGGRYAGGDISLLPEYEHAGAQYHTRNGEPIAELLPWLAEQGMNIMRVRIFVNPDDYTAADKDSNACQTIESVADLCRRIKAQGMALMVDFHYSDTWADPAKQWTPKAWQGLTDEALYAEIRRYTADCLRKLCEIDATPDFIQTGNEISFGMLWGSPGDADLKKAFAGSDANWERFTTLLKEAGRSCREVCPEAKVILHTERVADLPTLQNFYAQMDRYGVDFDIIGLSYYPYFHGDMATLDAALTMLCQQWPGKDVMIVETGFPYKWEVPGTTEKVDYEYSEAGQDEFARDLVATLERHSDVTGLLWWWMEYNAYGTTLDNWYNAPLFDSTTGRATSALTTICSFVSNAAIPQIEAPAEPAAIDLVDLAGRRVANPLPGLYINVTTHKLTVIR